MTAVRPKSGPRTVRAPRGNELSCKGWQQEAALRMLMNNLDPEVAEDPDHLIVYGGCAGVASHALTGGALLWLLMRAFAPVSAVQPAKLPRIKSRSAC